MRKYPTEYAYIVSIKKGEMVVGRISKYESMPCEKFGTYEEAEKEIERRKSLEEYFKRRVIL